jgi:hypothetical protein
MTLGAVLVGLGVLTMLYAAGCLLIAAFMADE